MGQDNWHIRKIYCNVIYIHRIAVLETNAAAPLSFQCQYRYDRCEIAWWSFASAITSYREDTQT